MDPLIVTRTVVEALGGITLLFVLIKINHVISLLKEQREAQLIIIKNQESIMATLADFREQIGLINKATENISAYVQGTGMSAEDQATALSELTTAVTALNNAIPGNAPTVAAITGNTSVGVGATSQLADSTTGGTWESSNTAVATVDATSGVVTGVAAGTATITYTVGTGSATTTVTVA